ncbi:MULTISPECIES: PTS sugar transporter subunit IIB [Paenibacillus]|jgi:PTS system ascorbate-specific IIB component|uniref:PTS system IIB component, L-Asc family (TC 4.A.7) n=1 Tax=Paenibacillus barengoltzii J12 TaxID=935846 RepID=A0ABY1M3I6_9BACL|nr:MULTISPECIES: PTS sugar transporter subunit IIB [Paenibacillus]EES74592.1 PTS system, Lactose/Cellobiose specific IIB subunit [Paenibacillus sp. oral taxon 786 str. D14]MDU0331266.1 PTS sugar transporter subunit IIB [Paenibacillus sp. 3LSP]MEC2346083.1 PTS sugar transporter subunit IIB [Paenibacillus barengoltzii]SMF20045.1 PTS system IIB component, L-Asc family (TC 4.A.7) [Paenibacillus barengoltzii]SMF68586.1 PTS system IIB component, L-Asc family (TC 4.A.7) [Paenibacillus barengoltzii J1
MKIICVCGLGQGTSLILRMNVETVLREMGIQAEVDHMDVSSASSMPADYIITNNELARSLPDHSAQIIIVNNYFDLEEIRQNLKEAM